MSETGRCLLSPRNPDCMGLCIGRPWQFAGETLTCRAFSAPPQSPSKGVCWRPIVPDNPDRSEPVTIETVRSNTDTERGKR